MNSRLDSYEEEQYGPEVQDGFDRAQAFGRLISENWQYALNSPLRFRELHKHMAEGTASEVLQLLGETELAQADIDVFRAFYRWYKQDSAERRSMVEVAERRAQMYKFEYLTNQMRLMDDSLRAANVNSDSTDQEKLLSRLRMPEFRKEYIANIENASLRQAMLTVYEGSDYLTVQQKLLEPASGDIVLDAADIDLAYVPIPEAIAGCEDEYVAFCEEYKAALQRPTPRESIFN